MVILAIYSLTNVPLKATTKKEVTTIILNYRYALIIYKNEHGDLVSKCYRHHHWEDLLMQFRNCEILTT